MGVPRPYRLPNAKIARARVRCSRAEIQVAPGIVVTGAKAAIVVRVRTYCSALRNAFKGWCKQHAVSVQFLHNYGGGGVDVHGHPHTAYYEIIGEPAALGAAAEQNWVESWEYSVNATVGHLASGSGPEKARSSGRPAKEPKWYGSQTQDAPAADYRIPPVVHITPATFSVPGYHADGEGI